MLDLQFWLLLGVLGTILLLREYQHQKIVRGLIDKILIKSGDGPLPEENPIQAVIEKLMPEERKPYNQPDKKKENREKQMVHFNVPGLDVMQAMAARRAVAEKK